MPGKPKFDWRILGLSVAAIAVGLALFLAQAAVPVTAACGDRTLWLHHTHTGKTAKFTYKHNGQFDYRTGEAVRAPVCVNLATFETRVDNGQVQVFIP